MKLTLKNQLHDFTITVKNGEVSVIDNKTGETYTAHAEVKITGDRIKINTTTYKAWCSFDKLRLYLWVKSNHSN